MSQFLKWLTKGMISNISFSHGDFVKGIQWSLKAFQNCCCNSLSVLFLVWYISMHGTIINWNIGLLIYNNIAYTQEVRNEYDRNTDFLSYSVSQCSALIWFSLALNYNTVVADKGNSLVILLLTILSILAPISTKEIRQRHMWWSFDLRWN